MHQTTNELIRDQLLDAQRRYLSELAHGGSALLDFDLDWSKLIAQVENGIQGGWLDDEVVQLAFESAVLFTTMGDSIAALETSANSMIVKTRHALAHLSLDDVVDKPSVKGSANHPVEYPLSPPCISPAYRWLVKNAHNPYPPASTKQALALEANLSTREIHEWFKTIRRSIGWVALCKKHFRGSRTLAVEAATQLLSAQQQTSYSMSIEIEVDLLLLQGRVECLYPDSCASRDLENGASSWDPFLHPRDDSHHIANQADMLPLTGPTCSEQPSCGAYPSPLFAGSLPTPSHKRKRRLSNADVEDPRKRSKFLPGEPRRQLVSDPLPSRPISNSNYPDFSWMESFTPLPIVTSVDARRPMNIIPNECSPLIDQDEATTLFSFVSSLLPVVDDQLVSPPVTIPELLTSQDVTSPITLSCNEVFPFADSLTVDSPLTDITLQQFLSSSDNSFDFSAASLTDNLSDTSSILTLSPPRTPSIPLSPHLPPSTTTPFLGPHRNFDIDSTSPSHNYLLDLQPPHLPSELDGIVIEKGMQRDSTAHIFPITEDFSLFDPTLSAFSFDFDSSSIPLLSVT